jgi:hypothetical protein
MRILLILVLIAAGLIVWQAHKHGCKYDATLINCVMGKSGGEQPAAETPAPAPAPAPEAPAPEAPAPAQ